jgi:hypothetical protein
MTAAAVVVLKTSLILLKVSGSWLVVCGGTVFGMLDSDRNCGFYQTSPTKTRKTNIMSLKCM